MLKPGFAKSLLGAISVVACVMVVLAACGGGSATATQVSGTSTAPAATPTGGLTPPATTASTRPIPPTAPAAGTQATATPTPTPAQTPTGPTPPAKRGGTLNIPILSLGTGGAGGYDSITLSGAAIYRAPMLNNLIWHDPYNPGPISGDVAEKWDVSADGKAITFTLRKGITFHDGVPLTSKDVTYNIDRAWKPRTPIMNSFKGRLRALAGIETRDDFTVRLELSNPSAYILEALASLALLVYPSHFPIENDAKLAEYITRPFGSGPFKFKSEDRAIGQDLIRNDSYWKPGLPYLDGIKMVILLDIGLVRAAYQTGKLDATGYQASTVLDRIDDFKKATGFVSYQFTSVMFAAQLNQRPPFTDSRVREAIDLAMDRQLLTTLFEGNGSPLVSPLLPPELGGRYGIPESEMKSRPGYREDKKSDIARALQLLKEAALDPTATKINILYTNLGATQMQDAVEASLRQNLGFQTQIDRPDSATSSQRTQTGVFDIFIANGLPTADDPLDFLVDWYTTTGISNPGKWSFPQTDALFVQQDREVDAARRKQLLKELQESVLNQHTTLPLQWRFFNHGHQPYVKNYPGRVPFLNSSRYQWEQVWIDKG